MAIDNIRLSNAAKHQLIKVKRYTGIKNWNVLCRWALATSLAERRVPPDEKIPADSSVEMTWRTFGGEYSDVYMALITQRCREDGLGTSDETVAKQFRLHLHRGIGILAAKDNVKSIEDLVRRACD